LSDNKRRRGKKTDGVSGPGKRGKTQKDGSGKHDEAGSISSVPDQGEGNAGEPVHSIKNLCFWIRDLGQARRRGTFQKGGERYPEESPWERISGKVKLGGKKNQSEKTWSV